MKIVYDPTCLEYERVGHPESPERIERIISSLRKDSSYEFVEPERISEQVLRLVHSDAHICSVKENTFSDPDTPNIKNIYTYALLSVQGAITASTLAAKGECACSCMRPPGHHAGKDFLEGFCYFNNIAIACEIQRQKGKKVSVLDIDVHHGNGTQDIFLGKTDLQYISIHQMPLYPGSGRTSQDNCINYPVPIGTTGNAYREILAKAIKDIARFSPDLLGISVGFDTYTKDPLAQIDLKQKDYRTIAQMIRVAGFPTFIIVEGGYSEDIGILARQFFEPFTT